MRINRPVQNRLFFIILVIWTLLPFEYGTAQTTKPPNIVLILIDDMGWKDFGEAGSTYYETPHIDRMAREGIRFTKGYSSAPVCSPSRGALLTGRYPARTKFTTVFGPHIDSIPELRSVAKEPEKKWREQMNNKTEDALHYHALPLKETTFANVFRKNGYQTGFLGKWHCGWAKDFWPDKRGFDYAEGFRTVPTRTPHFGRSAIGKIYGLNGLKPDDYIGDKLTDKAVAYIHKNADKDKPFLLMLNHFLVHGPLEGKESYIEKFKIKEATDQNKPVYAAMMQSIDESVGRIINALEEAGIDENTVVIFTSDNGGPIPTTSNYPLLGGKSFMFEAGMRVPFLVRWKGTISPIVDNEHRIIQTDLFPTMLDIAGIPLKPELHKDGRSFYPLLTQKGKWTQAPIFFHFPHYTHATSPATALIDGDWKLIRFYNNTEKEQYFLFNLGDDPYEQNDLIGENSIKLDEMTNLMQDYLSNTEGEMPVLNPDFDASKPGQLGKEYYYNFANKQRDEKKELLK
jgi:arylsulfatase A